MSWQFFLESAFCSRLCLALLHSLWQATVLAIVAFALTYFLRRRSAQVRYVIHVMALVAALVALPVTLTLVNVPSAPPAKARVPLAVNRAPRPAVASAPHSVAPQGGSASRAFVDESYGPGLPAQRPVDVPPSGALPAPGVSPAGLPTPAVAAVPAPAIAWSTIWRRVCPWLCGAYAVGVLLMLVRLGRGVRAEYRLRSLAQSTNVGALSRVVKELAAHWRMRVVPAVGSLTEIAVPRVIGLARPMILVPLSMTSGLTVEELQIVLAHELAHVRRYDIWVNLLQRLVEVALFFNPAIWLLSRRTSTLREYCCDDMVCQALSASAAPASVRYASALLRVAELSWAESRGTSLAAALACHEPLALAACGRCPSELKQRIARLLGEPLPRPLHLSRGSVAMLGGLVLALLLGPIAWTSANQGPRLTPKAFNASKLKTGKKSGETASANAGENSDASQPGAGHASDPSIVFQSMQVQAIHAQSREPLAGVELKVRYHFDHNYAVSYTTDAAGRADLQVPLHPKIPAFDVMSRPDTFVPVVCRWDAKNRPIEPPHELVIPFEPGTTIGGVVRDEAGQPVNGATLRLMLPITVYENSNRVFRLAEVATGIEGRWHCDVAPADLRRLMIHVEHPDFLRAGIPTLDEQQLHERTALTVLKQGATITGRVTDEAGRPIREAHVVAGIDRTGSDEPQTRTDAEGNFVLRKCKPGRSAVTVMAAGYSPDIKPISAPSTPVEPAQARPAASVSPADGSLLFQLKPAKTLRGRLVDLAGKPIQGAVVAADTWRGHQTLRWRVQTDAAGRFVWESAPADGVAIDMEAGGFVSIRNRSLVAQSEEYEIVMQPTMVISGRVTDAETGKPLEHFQVIPGVILQGRDDVVWNRGETMSFADGGYEVRFSEPRYALQLRIEANGYEPVVSGRFNIEDGNRPLDFELVKGPAISGRVLDADGQPVAGADVVRLEKHGRLQLLHGYFDRRSNIPFATTDADGHFEMMNSEGPFLLLAVHDAGFAEVLTEPTAKPVEIHLNPWARVEGQMFVGGQPAANQPVDCYRLAQGPEAVDRLDVQLNDPSGTLLQSLAAEGRSTDNPAVATLMAQNDPTKIGRAIVQNLGVATANNTQIKTDAQGCFDFQRVVPGNVFVARVLVVHHSTSTSNCGTHGVRINLAPGDTGLVTLGGAGKPVVGRVEVPTIDGRPHDWSENETIQLSLVKEEVAKLGEQGPSLHFYRGYVARDGSFRVDDVPPGRYDVNLAITPPPNGHCGFGDVIGRVATSVIVPATPDGALRSDEPVEMGTLKPQMTPRLNVGDRAPEFKLAALDGTQVSLSALRGKVVLLDFWASWWGPCLAELPSFEAIHDGFGEHPRFVMLGLSLDQTPKQLEEFATSRKLAWPQIWLQNAAQNQVCQDYIVRSIPSTYLIGPDGRVIGKDLQDAALREAIAGALAELPDDRTANNP